MDCGSTLWWQAAAKAIRPVGDYAVALHLRPDELAPLLFLPYVRQ